MTIPVVFKSLREIVFSIKSLFLRPYIKKNVKIVNKKQRRYIKDPSAQTPEFIAFGDNLSNNVTI